MRVRKCLHVRVCKGIRVYACVRVRPSFATCVNLNVFVWLPALASEDPPSSDLLSESHNVKMEEDASGLSFAVASPNGKSRTFASLADSPVASSPPPQVTSSPQPAASPAASEATARTIHSLHLLQSGVGGTVDMFTDEDEETTLPGADVAGTDGEAEGGAGPKDGNGESHG